MQNKSSFPLRVVRSFVRRQGRMSPIQKYALDVLWKKYGLEIKNSPIEMGEKCILEIGFGMGQSLIQQAQQNPATDFIGIEVHRPGIGAVLVAIDEHDLKNIRLFCADAIEVLTHCIPNNSVDKVQLFFPDPWPKRRHHKRRLVQPTFVELIRQKLKPAGVFHLATDWQDYAQHMLTVLTIAPGFKNVFGEKQFAPHSIDRPATKFEQRGKNLGHGVWDLLFIKQ
jgi:tRNA (guanine-N7-)-methyltransferase